MSNSADAATTLPMNIDVSDLRQAVEFYTTGLGLTVRRRPYPNIVELQAGRGVRLEDVGVEGTANQGAAPSRGQKRTRPRPGASRRGRGR